MQGFFATILFALTAPRFRAHAAFAALAGSPSGGRPARLPGARPTLRVGVASVSHVAQSPRRAPVTPSIAFEPIADDEIALFTPAPAEPHGVRVVPYRPGTAWPEARRVHPRIYDPFRAFPQRATLLGQIMHTDDRRE
jgi:hypothetical protein